ncbi:hypothetical protein PV726_32020 [Streptomyces europaeiscabiei]|uniref:hypothetical protein n=1 Tax=Streptomyces europaeiscabiei TaxID=146819 RepID=UPI0029A0FFD5|nr:hypothetical protein [Streptomyces europaeiscabiei]MDX3694883.1 hypothetical protein [Streptomyces europaeiscabiei]
MPLAPAIERPPLDLPSTNDPQFEEHLCRFLDSLDTSWLHRVEAMSISRQVPRYEERLLGLLRTGAYRALVDGLLESPWPVADVRFGSSVYDNGTFWDDYSVDLVHFDGTVTTLDLDDLDVDEQDLPGVLADHASTVRPDDGDTLTINLRTGEFSY